MEATPANEDDVIVISSPLHKTTTITFKLTNRKKAYVHKYILGEGEVEFRA
jgi:hypothetical protein